MRLVIVPFTPTLVLAATTLAAQAPLARYHPPVVPDCVAKHHAGELVTVEGLVVSIVVSARSDTVFLNLGASGGPPTFSAVLFRPFFSRFPNVQKWRGKRVRVTGVVQLEQGRSEIFLTDPTQLRGATWYVFPARPVAT